MVSQESKQVFSRRGGRYDRLSSPNGRLHQGCVPPPHSIPLGLRLEPVGSVRRHHGGGAHREKGPGNLEGAQEFGGRSRVWRGSGKQGGAPQPEQVRVK
jgi:hypothetical protein